MKKLTLLFALTALAISLMSQASAAHYIVGIVNDALDGMQANGHTVVLWQPSNGINDNQTDIIGPLGNSGTDNTYMIDCELLNDPCGVGDTVAVQVIDNGDGYVTGNVTGTATGAGYDAFANLTLNSKPNVTLVIVDDSLAVPLNEIDLTPATTRGVTCNATIRDLDGELGILSARAVFYDSVHSFQDESDDNNEHYTNNTCIIDLSYGDAYEALATCLFDVWYYANNATWNCNVTTADNFTKNGSGYDSTYINTLIAIDVPSVINFDIVNANTVSNQNITNVTNYGNVAINLTLDGYGAYDGDGRAMNCTLGAIKNISIEYEKYNLTASTTGSLTLAQLEQNYLNLTDTPTVKKLNLNQRQNDALNEAWNATYWRIYVPTGVAGTCSGIINFAATQSAGD
jgi:hypothetical protein